MIDKLNSTSKIKIHRCNLISFNINSSYAVKNYDFKPSSVSSTISRFLENNKK